MRTMRPDATLVALALVAGALTAACSSSGTMKTVRAWSDPEMTKGSVKKVYVIAVAENQALRKSYEDTCVQYLTDLKYAAVPGYQMVDDPTKVDKNELAAKLKADGVTHVLVSRVVNRQEVEEYHPPSTMYVGGGYYGGYPGYYGGWYPYWSTGYSAVTSPGYTTTKTMLAVESNLYDLSTEKMVFTGLSEGSISEDPFATINKYIYSVMYEMRAKGVI